MPAVLADVAPGLSPGCLLTDVGSVKGWVVEALPGLLPDGVELVAAHPMAGSHLRGPDHARADLRHLHQASPQAIAVNTQLGVARATHNGSFSTQIRRDRGAAAGTCSARRRRPR